MQMEEKEKEMESGSNKRREQRLETINAFLIRTYNPTFNIYHPATISYQNIQNEDQSLTNHSRKTCLSCF